MLTFEPLDEHIRTHTEALELIDVYTKTMDPSLFSILSLQMGSRPRLIGEAEHADIGFPTILYFSNRPLYKEDFGKPLCEPIPLDDLAGFLGGAGKENQYLVYANRLEERYPYFDVYFHKTSTELLAQICITKHLERMHDPWHALLEPSDMKTYGILKNIHFQ